MGRPPIPFTKEIVDLMGKVPDAQIARMAKCSNTAVINRRIHLGIPPYTGYRLAEKVADPTSATATAPTDDLAETLRNALKKARPAKDGMVLPYDTFARLVQSVLS